MWGYSEGKAKKLHLLNWARVCQPKNRGGLGLMPIHIKNDVQLGKWVWRAYRERDSFWNKLMVQRYGSVWNYNLSAITSKQCSPIVKGVISTISNPQVKGIFNNSNYKWTANSGSMVLFWEDAWILTEALCNRYPDLYNNTTKQNVTVQNLVDDWLQNNMSVWKSPPSSSDMALISHISLLIQLHNFSPRQDSLIWKPSNKAFNSRDACSLILDFNSHNETSGSSIWNFIWSFKVPPKLHAFLWKLAWGILPTNLFLQNRLGTSNPSCVWCSMSVELTSHLFWDCQLAAWTWEFIDRWWSQKHIELRAGAFSLHSLFYLKEAKFVKNAWHLVVTAALWSIWLARNELVFKKKRIKKVELETIIMIRISKWGKAAAVMNFGEDPLWRINPWGALKIHHLAASNSFWQYRYQNYDLTCMVDGAFDNNQWGQLGGGIGGCIKDRHGKTIYCFSRPIGALSAIEAEISAILHVMHHLLLWQSFNKNVVVCSDSVGAINAIYEGLDINFPLLVPNFEVASLLRKNVTIQYVPSDLNDNADKLARDGIRKPGLNCFWAG